MSDIEDNNSENILVLDSTNRITFLSPTHNNTINFLLEVFDGENFIPASLEGLNITEQSVKLFHDFFDTIKFSGDN
jgi:hypothetical protein